MKKIVDKYAPVKKVAAGLSASAIVYLAHRYLQLDLGSEATAEALIPAVGFLVSYAAKDGRVRPVLDAAEKLVEAHEDLA